MNIDWEAVLQKAFFAARDAAAKNAPQVEHYLREIAAAHEYAIRSLARALGDSDIDLDTFKSEMDDEAAMLAAELHVVAVMGKAVAQRAANAFRDALADAVVMAMKLAV